MPLRPLSQSGSDLCSNLARKGGYRERLFGILPPQIEMDQGNNVVLDPVDLYLLRGGVHSRAEGASDPLLKGIPDHLVLMILRADIAQVAAGVLIAVQQLVALSGKGHLHLLMPDNLALALRAAGTALEGIPGDGVLMVLRAAVGNLDVGASILG